LEDSKDTTTTVDRFYLIILDKLKRRLFGTEDIPLTAFTVLRCQEVSHRAIEKLAWQDTLPGKRPSWARGYRLGQVETLAGGVEQM
jgi:hypothetical protein